MADYYGFDRARIRNGGNGVGPAWSQVADILDYLDASAEHAVNDSRAAEPQGTSVRTLPRQGPADVTQRAGPMTPLLIEAAYGRLWIDPDDIVGRTLLGVQGEADRSHGIVPARADGHFWDGELLVPLYDECAKPGAFVIIVGANFGQDALYCAARGARVLAVEAQPLLVELLRLTVALNGEVGARIVLLDYAAYDRAERFAITAAGSSVSSWGVVPAPDGPIAGGPLDPFIGPHLLGGQPITLIQVDAQGCDLRALIGLTETLAAHRPVVVFEYEANMAAHHGDGWDLHRGFFDALGYTLTESPTHPNNWIARPQ